MGHIPGEIVADLSQLVWLRPLLTENAIVLGCGTVLVKRIVESGCWEISILDDSRLAALLSAAYGRSIEADNAAIAALKAAAWAMKRDRSQAAAEALQRYGLEALPNGGAERLTLANTLLKSGVAPQNLLRKMRLAPLNLRPVEDYARGLTITEDGVVLGAGAVIARLSETPEGRIGLEVDGREERILTLLSIAQGRLMVPDLLRKFHNAAQALEKGEVALAHIHLAHAGLTRLPDSDDGLTKALNLASQGMERGVAPFALLKGLNLLPSHATAWQWDRWVKGEAFDALGKAGVNDPSPGWPKGTPNGLGGKFRPYKNTTPGIGHNGGPPLEDAIKGKVSAKVRSAAVKMAIRHLVKAGMVTADILAPEVMIPLGIAIEVADAAYPYVKAYFDPPHTLEELQQAANSPESGYDIHHIVEQATASPDGSEGFYIDGPENLVRIPTAKHWDLNRWYERPDPKYGGLSPRDYCKGKSWEERQRVGLDGLREIGVLTP